MISIGLVRHVPRKLAVLATLGVLAACPVGAEEYKQGEDPFSVIMKWRPTTEAGEMKDFVKQTRPSEDQLQYTPLTGDTPDRPKVKSKNELGATMSGLDKAAAAARARGAALGGADRAEAARRVQAAAESRRRAVEAFEIGAKPAAAKATP
jgi:hypothetical protein